MSLLAVGAKNSSYTTVCSGERRGFGEIDFLFVCSFCSMSWLIWRTNLKISVWQLCLIQLLPFLWCRWLKLTISHVLTPYFHQCLFWIHFWGTDYELSFLWAYFPVTLFCGADGINASKELRCYWILNMDWLVWEGDGDMEIEYQCGLC